MEKELKRIKFEDFKRGKDFQTGVELFRARHNLEPKYPEIRKELEGKIVQETPAVKFQWYRKVVSGRDYKDKYQNLGYPILNQTYERIIIKGKEKKVLKEVEFAYMSVSKTLDLPIADYDSLQKIDSYLKSKNSYPRPFEKKEN